jgi:hypothetical protein
MTDFSTGRSTPRRENRHDQAVLSSEVRRLVGVLRTGGPRQRASLQQISHAEQWREGSFDRALTDAIRAGKARARHNLLAASRPSGGQTGRPGPQASPPVPRPRHTVDKRRTDQARSR